MMKLNVTTGIDEATQESSHMNATLQGIGEDRAISIAVHLPDGAHEGVDLDNEEAVRTLLAGIFESALAKGCEIDVQVGRSRDAVDEED